MIAEFFSMGGYGFYVWMSMGMALLVMVIEIASLKMGFKKVIMRIKRLIAMSAQQRGESS